MSKLKALALVAGLSFGPATAFAHGQPPAPAHGGLVQEAHENWVELVVKGDQVRVYVLDEAQKPVSSAQVTGTATVMVEGKPQKVELHPADDGGLLGKLPVPASGKMLATVSLKVRDQPASARFNLAS